MAASSVSVLKSDTTEDRAEHARLSAFVGAIAIGDLVKSTLGPRGMDKILQSASGRGEMQVTNDGATILKSLHVDNPAAKVLVNLSRVQDEEVGDGTTSVCVLAAELLREAERLVDQHRIHPQIIIAGYRKAAQVAREALESVSTDRSIDSTQFREDLIKIAKTTLSSKILAADKEHFAKLAVDAVLCLQGSPDLERIGIVKKMGGRLVDSYLDNGLILDKRMGGALPPNRQLRDARILIANTAMDTDKIKIYGSRFKVSGPEALAEFERAERDRMKEKVEAIRRHGINCFVNRQLIYNWPEQLFTDAGIVTVEHADFEGVERLALVTGGQIVSTFDEPGTIKLGKCELIEEIIVGDDRMVRFSGGAASAACTVILRGATTQMLAEAERSLHDALCVLTQTVKEPRTVLGGGASEMLMAAAIDAQAPHLTTGKEMLAMESFARALRQLPTALADNGGYDGAELVANLRSMHAQGFKTAGLDMERGSTGDMMELGIVESLKLKRQVLISAAEASEMILRVDDIIKAAPRQRTRA